MNAKRFHCVTLFLCLAIGCSNSAQPPGENSKARAAPDSTTPTVSIDDLARGAVERHGEALSRRVSEEVQKEISTQVDQTVRKLVNDAVHRDLDAIVRKHVEETLRDELRRRVTADYNELLKRSALNFRPLEEQVEMLADAALKWDHRFPTADFSKPFAETLEKVKRLLELMGLHATTKEQTQVFELYKAAFDAYREFSYKEFDEGTAREVARAKAKIAIEAQRRYEKQVVQEVETELRRLMKIGP